MSAGEAVDRIRRAGTLTSRDDTPEGRLAMAIERVLIRRVLTNSFDGNVMVTAQEIAEVALAALSARAEGIRAETIEECARVAEMHPPLAAHVTTRIAKAIRALSPPGGS